MPDTLVPVCEPSLFLCLSVILPRIAAVKKNILNIAFQAYTYNVTRLYYIIEVEYLEQGYIYIYKYISENPILRRTYLKFLLYLIE